MGAKRGSKALRRLSRTRDKTTSTYLSASMTAYYNIYSNDEVNAFWVFRHIDAEGILVVRPEYDELACKNCGKIDELEALNKGLPSCIPPLPQVDAIESCDDMMFVNRRVRDVIEQACIGDARFYPLPEAEKVYLLLPTTFLLLTEGDPASTMVDKCSTCGRCRELIWGADPPKIPSDKHLMAFRLESRAGLMPAWIGSQRLVSALKAMRPKLKGLFFDAFDPA